MVARVFLVCFDSCVLLAVFAPAAFVPACVSVAVAGSVAHVAAPCVVSGPDPPAVPLPYHVLVVAAAAIAGVPHPAGHAVAPVVAPAFCRQRDWT